MDRLSNSARTVLDTESASLPQHLGLLLLLDTSGGAFPFARFADLVRARLHLAPRLRQRLQHVPLDLATPVWLDDPDLDLGYHVRHAALPSPGGLPQLTDVVARLLSRPLDRDRPLWEAYVFEGLAEDRAAVFVKTHLALVDAADGNGLASLLLAASAEDHDELPPPEPWQPRRTPSPRELAGEALADLVGSPLEAFAAARRLGTTPARIAAGAVEVGRGLAAAASTSLRGPSSTSVLSTTPGRARRFAVHRLDLERLRHVRHALAAEGRHMVEGLAINDVVLALVGDALGRFLRLRGVRTERRRVTALVPVATRPDRGEDAELALRDVVSVDVELPVGEMDPVERLRRISADVVRATRDQRVVGARVLMNLAGFAPPVLHGLGARVSGASAAHDLVVSNAPGPAAPRWLLGTRVVGSFPSVPLGPSQALSVAVTSADGGLHVGLTADWDALPDVGVITGYLDRALDELVQHADAVSVRGELARRPTPGNGT